MGVIFNFKKREDNLEKYLECETKLNEFFSLVSFCYDECLSQKYSKFDGTSCGRHGCCTSDFYLPIFSGAKGTELNSLIKDRDLRYNFHKHNENLCNYHTYEGCKLKTHKSPICIAYICEPFRDFLLSLGIDYNVSENSNFLLQVLTGQKNNLEIEKFKKKIDNWLR